MFYWTQSSIWLPKKVEGIYNEGSWLLTLLTTWAPWASWAITWPIPILIASNKYQTCRASKTSQSFRKVTFQKLWEYSRPSSDPRQRSTCWGTPILCGSAKLRRHRKASESFWKSTENISPSRPSLQRPGVQPVISHARIRVIPPCNIVAAVFRRCGGWGVDLR